MARKMAEKPDLPKTDAGLQTWLQNRRPPAEREWHALGHGLTVCLSSSGDITFQARLRRVGDTNARRIALGAFPECTVAEARQRLLAARASVKEGRDPALGRRRAREGVVDVATFGQLAAHYLADRISEGELRPKTILVERQAVAKLRRALGDFLLADVTPLVIAETVKKEAARLRKSGRSGRTANLMLAICKRVFRYGTAAGLLTSLSPAADLRRPVKERPRDRILFDGVVLRPPPPDDEGEEPRHGTSAIAAADVGEVGRLALALADEAEGTQPGTRAALMLALLTGARAGEIAALKWSAVHLEAAVPAISITQAKTDAGVRVLPLPPQAVAILQKLRAETPSGRFIFPGRSDGGRAEHLHPESMSRAFSRLCGRLEIRDAVLHDLRRTALSALMELTGDPWLSQKIAGHRPSSTLGRVYDKSAQLDAALKALTAWADAIDAAADLEAAALEREST